MPRLSPCRVLRILAFPWIFMFALWCFLPSPTVSDGQRVAYIQNALSSGRTVITMLEYPSFKRQVGRTYGGECGECDTILPHWRLEAVKNDILLHLNNEDWYKADINITGTLKDAQLEFSRTSHVSEGKWVPYFSKEIKLPNIPGGSPDEEINLPWFAGVDQNLFHHDMHGMDASITLHAVVPTPGVVEIWKSSAVELAAGNVPTEHDRYVAIDGLAGIKMYKVLLQRQNLDRLAVLKVPEPAKVKTIVVEELEGDLPSMTYPIRKFLLFPLGPIIIFPFLLFQLVYGFVYPVWPAIYVLFAVYTPIVFYYWIKSGRPQIWSWLTTFWMTRWLFACGRRRNARAKNRDVWGPAGPVGVNSTRGSFDEEKVVGLQRPQTVRLGRDWKA